MTDQSNTAEQLPQDPTDHVINVVKTSLETQNIHTIEAQSKTLANISATASGHASQHIVSKITNETSSITSSGNAEIAVNDENYNFQTGKADEYGKKAETEHVSATSDNAKADKTIAQSEALKAISTVQVAVAQAEELKKQGIAKITDDTQEAVKKDMKESGAVNDLESKLELLAKHDPKVNTTPGMPA